MESSYRSTWKHFLLAFVVVGLCVGALAQGGIGELTGDVTDSTGAVVSGVEIKLTNVATGEVRTTVTTPAGSYRFPALPIVGSYTLEVTDKGFKSVKIQNIVATVGTIVTRDVTLEVGSATEQVTVEAGAQLVQTQDSALSQNVDKQVWTNMPLETRSQNEFLGLLAGAEPAAEANIEDRGPAVNGTRSGSGNFMVEGFSNNDLGVGGAANTIVGSGGAVTTISPDAIQEYRVIDSTPPAEYGQAGGFVTDTVLKGGTNQFHGSLFEYNRIQDLAANSWFSNFAGEQDHLVRNQFGGSGGGPIIKDKMFFYYTLEYQRLRTSSPLTGDTYTSDFVKFVNDGDFETFQESNPGGICNELLGASCPGAFAASAAYPTGSASLAPVYSSMAAIQTPVLCTTGAANCKNFTNVAQGLYTAGYYALENPNLPAPVGTLPLVYPVNVYGTATVSQPEIFNQVRNAVKFDYKLGGKDQLNVAYLIDNQDQTVPYGDTNFTFGPTSFEHLRSQTAGVTLTHTFSPTVLNQARMSYLRHTLDVPGDPKVAGMPDTFMFFDEPAFAFGNADNIPQFFTENEFIYKDDLSVAHGKNNFKGGGEYRRTRNGRSFELEGAGLNGMQDVEDFVTSGNFTNQLEDLLVSDGFMTTQERFGSIAESEASLNPLTGQLPDYYRGYRANEAAAYFQDDWRLSPRLTVNLGLRWEYFGPPHNFQKGLDANFYQGVPVTPIATTSTNPFFPVNSPYAALFATGTVQQRNNNIWDKDLHNFGPRVGFSWDAMGNQKVVVRGGFGINYDRIYNNVFENIRFNPPYFALGLLGSIVGEATITPAETAALATFPFKGTSTFLSSPLTPELRAMDQNIVTPYYEQAHLGVQYEIGKDMMLESNYVGTFGHKLIGVLNRNTYDGRFAGDDTPINPDYANINFRTNCCDSNYHAFQTTLRKRFTNGLQFNANYTYSKAMDTLSDAFDGKGTAAGFPSDNLDPHLDYGPADYNVKNRGVVSFVYDLPFAKANRWIGGWNVSGILSVQDGANFSIFNSSVDTNKDGDFNDRAVYIGSGAVTNSISHSKSPALGYYNPADFASLGTPALPCPLSVNMGLWCNGPGEMQRNSLVGPGFFNTDIGFGKLFKINERAALKFEANFFNILNHPNFLPPDNNLNDTTAGLSLSTFSNQQTGGPRITQLALRFDF